MRIVGVLLILTSMFACRQTTKVTGEKELGTNVPAPKSEQSCYAYIKEKDTAQLILITTGVVATGELNYKWFEKDKSTGHIAGEMRGDTLIANYTFNSEGKQSVRQVAFLKKGNQFLEGFGEIQEKEGKMQFKDLKKIDYEKAIVFEKIACN